MSPANLVGTHTFLSKFHTYVDLKDVVNLTMYWSFLCLVEITNREEVSMKVIPFPSKDNDIQLGLIVR